MPVTAVSHRAAEPATDPTPPWWTEADAAELSALTWELAAAVEHRAACATCRRIAANRDAAERWKCHCSQCRACKGDAPLSHGPACDAGLELRSAIGSESECPHIRRAIETVLDWHTRRELLSRAVWLRRQRELLEYETDLLRYRASA